MIVYLEVFAVMQRNACENENMPHVMIKMCVVFGEVGVLLTGVRARQGSGFGASDLSAPFVDISV